MKKILSIMVLGLLLNGNAYSKEIIISCKSAKYKYVNDGQNILVYSTNKKRDKSKWHEWLTVKLQEDNKHFFKSAESKTIIEGYKVTQKFKKVVTKQGTAKNGKTTIDFKNKTRKSKATWKGKRYSASEKCRMINTLRS